MQTTIVYVLTSSEKDIYLEQLWLSVYSLRQYHPEANVILLTDKKTEVTLVGNRAKVREYLSEVKVVDVPEEYSPKERSRYIKTTYRRYLKGNLLFLDTDTVIAESLSEIDSCEADIACVLDYHAPLDNLADGTAIRERILDIFGERVNDEQLYFNSGVMFVRDTPEVHHFFNVWHEHWIHAAFEKKQCFDQPALLMANRKCDHVIKELDGIYNCQVLTSIQYLHHAKIIHFFNNGWEGKAELSPFFNDKLYRQMKEEGNIPETIIGQVVDCRAAFLSPAYFQCRKRYEYMNTLVGATMYSEWQKGGLLFKFVNCLCELRYSLIKLRLRGKV